MAQGHRAAMGVLLGGVMGVLVCQPATARAQDLAPRPTVIVDVFDTDRTGWVPPPHLGETIADLLGDHLVTSGRFRVMDRGWIDGHDQAVPLAWDPAGVDPSLLERAERAGVHFVVRGAITRFTTEQYRRGLGLGVRLVIGGYRRERTESTIGLTLRVIDVRTGEVVVAATILGRAGRGKLSIGAAGMLTRMPAMAGGGSARTGDPEALVAEAVVRAVDLAGLELASHADRLAGLDSGARGGVSAGGGSPTLGAR